MSRCEECLGLDVDLSAIPAEFTFRTPRPTLAEARKRFGPCPACSKEFQAPDIWPPAPEPSSAALSEDRP